MFALRRLALCLALFTVLVAPPPAAAQQDSAFLSVIEDIPLMPGLTEDETAAVVFDATGGRIAETAASGPSFSRPAVLAFYGETLPALGWQAEGEARWLREGESLAIEFDDAPGKGQLVVRFYLSPAKP